MKKYLALGVVAIVIIGGVIIWQSNNDPAPTPVKTVGSYVALGDSVAAGVGLEHDSDASACDRTDQSYPNLIAKSQHYALTNVACSGATLPAGILEKQDVNQLLVTPQIDQLFAHPEPTLITITIGANDTDWTNILTKCYTGQCGTTEDTAAVTDRLATAASNLRKVLTQLQTQYKFMPKVIVTGYHQVFPATGTCSDLAGIDTTELAWGRQLQTSINDTVKAATADFPGVAFVPINFSGHELCTSDSWVQGLSDPKPYHPTAAGQRAFSKQIIATLQAAK